jgi:zinc D-Ala-D-Ala dipeptidase
MIIRFITLFFLFGYINAVYALPAGFVYLHDIDPSILQDIRYAGFHNFIGRPIKGYQAKQCILTQEAAYALAKVQKKLKPLSLSLKVYDCYRPTLAVADFVAWSKDRSQQQMKTEFYPRVDKADVFRLGYVAKKSGHSSGSTVDLTIVPIPTPSQASYHPQHELVSCTAPYQLRYHDNSIDMGTGFDCMDVLSHALNPEISKMATQQRLLLRQIMIQYGFEPYENEWWHFTLKNEPFADKYFNFIVR